jgi:iron complex outermembrane receptor protein
VFKATPNVSLYANYIEGLVKGSVAPPTTPNSQPVNNAGQVFAPYASKQKEIGAKYDAGKWGGSAAFFTTTQPIAFVQNQTYGINGEQRNQGLEFSLYGEPVKGLRLLGGVTLINAEQTRMEGGLTNGRDAIGVPRQQLNLNAEWDVAGVRGLALNARVLHTSSQYANAANTQVVPAWNRLDLSARYLMDIGNNRLLTLRGRIDNALNSSYWASAGGYPGSNYLVLGAPRTLVVSGSIDF